MHSFKLVLAVLLLALLPYTLAAPQVDKAVQVNKVVSKLAAQRQLCVLFLKGKKPADVIAHRKVTSTVTLPAATLTVPLTISETTTLTETDTAFETSTFTTELTETETVTEFTTITTTITPAGLSRRSPAPVAAAANAASAAKSLRVLAAGYADDVISEACLLIVYNPRPSPVTVTSTLTTSTQLPTSTVTSTAFVTETDSVTESITSTLTATATITNTATLTTTSTAFATATAPAGCTSPFTCGGGSFSYCNGGSSGCICIGDSTGTVVTCVPGSTSCASRPKCSTDVDCGSGNVCAVNTCCGVPICVPIQYTCQALTARDYLLGRDGPVGVKLGDMFTPH